MENSGDIARKSSLDHESSAVQKHLEIMQGVIGRMAENSRSCKVWCVTLVAATLVLVARTGEPRHALVALAPTTLFYVLDAYYLMLEKRFRNSYNCFVDKVHSADVAKADLYSVAGTGSKICTMLRAMSLSISVLPFYFTVIVTVILAWQFIL